MRSDCGGNCGAVRTTVDCTMSDDWLKESLKASRARLAQMSPEKHKQLEDAEAFRQARIKEERR